jgi:outer membrane protein TolC
MRGLLRSWRPRSVNLLGKLLPLLLAAGGIAVHAADVLPPDPNPPTGPAVVPAPLALDLSGYRHLSLEKQAALAAYRASLAAAEGKVRALDHLGLAGALRRDLPQRRCQAQQGVVAAQAQLSQAEWDTVYGVTRNYFSALYAVEQKRLADETATSLSDMEKRLNDLFKQGAEVRRDLKVWHLESIRGTLAMVRGRRVEAEEGIPRALAALREAVGLEPTCPILVPPEAALPGVDSFPPVVREQIVELALARRGEIIQANVGLQVTALEIKAQSRILRPLAATFASGSDLHAQPVPLGVANGEYRPGAIGLEMPVNLVGKRPDRVDQAHALHGRADAVVEKTRQLIALQADEVFYRWKQATRQYADYTEAVRKADLALKLITDEYKDLGVQPGTRPSFDDLLNARIQWVQMRLLRNEAQYEVLLALAALERVTAGGYCPGFDQPLPLPPGAPQNKP